ncbi:outer membrane autotransporter barrel domain-containing protein [Candidatus Bartonella washoeensis Sb944nv]|uniref:Outer membrane autotransporter barrel domain-containing protein n=2 Tax=Candidatus Bartonella washoeensis TaxID=186739 RepID=J0Q1D3_9HYPH|nr:outer membrane autotransporter barrel domain-containing protein [Bartonella washoeensis Sb944nv]
MVKRDYGKIMVKISKNHLSLCAVTTSVLFFVHNAGAKVENNNATHTTVQARSVIGDKTQNDENQFSCDESGSSYRCNDGKVHYIAQKTYKVTDKSSDKTVAIQASKKDTFIEGWDITIQDALNRGGLDSNFSKYGIVADNFGSVDIEKGEIDFTNGIGVQTRNGGQVYLSDFSITEKGRQVTNINSHNKNTAFQMSEHAGFIKFKKGEVKVSNAHGISFQGIVSNIDILDSTVLVEGNASYGFLFFNEQERKDEYNGHPYQKEEVYIFFGEDKLFGSLPKENLSKRGNVHLYNTVFTVPNSIAIYSIKSGGLVQVLEHSELSGDLLLKVENGSFVKVAADESILIGGTRIDESSDAEFRLSHGSKWTLTRPKNGSFLNSVSSGSIGVSSISLVHLIDDSSIVFEQPNSGEAGNYQTLHIGKGEGEVYKAQDGAHIYLNTYLNSGGSIENQQTDRVLIDGDVEGETIVHVQSVPGSPGGYTGSGGSNQGISIIQVSGEAKEHSFQLAGGYVALKDSPYQYGLYAYGPTSVLGKADPAQRLVNGSGDFWDFRLENQYVQSPIDYRDTFIVPEKAVRAVVPQVPTYLLLPNSIFHAGFMDISNQNKQLEILRATSSGMMKIHEKPASFLRGYGGSYHYASDLSAFEYGYGGDFAYNALEAGVLLQTIENADSAISIGVMGTYGKLSLQPQDVEQSQKSAFDKWAATAYGSMQHDAGFYVDGLFSYGLLKGDVLTRARGKTATLKGNPLSVSLTAGQTLAMRYEGFVVDPQVQVVYQHLQFSKAHDVDNFDIEMGKLDKWMVRVGGRLTKTFSATEKDREASFYGKLHFTHGFEGKQTVYFKDAFQLGAFGSSLEAGLGLNARLSSKFALHADLVYQHKLTKAGFSGISFSGGVRYQF